MKRLAAFFTIEKSDFRKPSVVTLVAANLYPVIGVLLLDWDVFPVLLLYWTENIVLGVLNAVKMVMASPHQRHLWPAKLFMVPFFCIHYGLFTMGHGVFIFALFSEYVEFFDVTGMAAVITDYHLTWGIISVFASHLFSFIYNYVRKREYRDADLAGLMMQPYGRVFLLHTVTILGGFCIVFFGAPEILIIILVLFKIGTDLLAHLRQHQISE